MKKKHIIIIVIVSVFIVSFYLALLISGYPLINLIQSNYLSKEIPATTTMGVSEYYIGDDVYSENSILEVKEVHKLKSDDNNKPRLGMEFVAVKIKISNKSNDIINTDEYNLKLLNSKGQFVSPCIYKNYDKDTLFENVELMAKSSVEGTLIFEAPIDDSNLSLCYRNFYGYEEQGDEITSIYLKNKENVQVNNEMFV